MRSHQKFPPKNFCGNQKGFTLLELLAVLAIIAVCSAVLWPCLPVHGHRKLEAAARNLADDLRLCRQAAITSGEFCKITFYNYDQSYELRLPGKKYKVHLPAGIGFGSLPTFQKDSPGGSPYVHFNILGHPSGGGTAILKSKQGSKLYVIVTPVTGRVRISRDPPQHWPQ